MTDSLPGELLEVFERSVTAEYVTIDGRGQPVVWPATPSYHAAEGCIDVTRDADQIADSSANAHVALLFCDTAGLGAAPMVLVQGTAQVDAETVVGHAAMEGGGVEWDARFDGLGDGVLAFVGPDGFPFAVRVPVHADSTQSVIRIEADPVGAPIEPGLACLCAHDGRFHALGDLDEDRGRWVLRPHRVATAAAQGG